MKYEVMFWVVAIALAILGTRLVLGSSDAKPEPWERREESLPPTNRILKRWYYEETESRGTAAMCMRFAVDPLLRYIPWNKLDSKGNIYKFYGKLYIIHMIGIILVFSMMYYEAEWVATFCSAGYIILVCVMWRFTLFYHGIFPFRNFSGRGRRIHHTVGTLATSWQGYLLWVMVPVAVPVLMVYAPILKKLTQ